MQVTNKYLNLFILVSPEISGVGVLPILTITLDFGFKILRKGVKFIYPRVKIKLLAGSVATLRKK